MHTLEKTKGLALIINVYQLFKKTFQETKTKTKRRERDRQTCSFISKNRCRKNKNNTQNKVKLIFNNQAN